MSFPLLRLSAVYQRHLRSAKRFVKKYASLRTSSPFICISSALFNWSNQKGMHI